MKLLAFLIFGLAVCCIANGEDFRENSIKDIEAKMENIYGKIEELKKKYSPKNVLSKVYSKGKEFVDTFDKKNDQALKMIKQEYSTSLAKAKSKNINVEECLVNESETMEMLRGVRKELQLCLKDIIKEKWQPGVNMKVVQTELHNIRKNWDDLNKKLGKVSKLADWELRLVKNRNLVNLKKIVDGSEQRLLEAYNTKSLKFTPCSEPAYAEVNGVKKEASKTGKVIKECIEKKISSSMITSTTAKTPGTSPSPATPSTPATPGTPSTTPTPSTPSTPSTSASPNTPSTPTTPSTPATSQTPATPTTPSTPSTPATPTTSATPTTQATPSTPSTSATSSTPATPANPATSATSATPEISSSPSTPSTPATPATPSTPPTSATSSTPATPTTSATSSNPSTQSTPATPSTPASPETPTTPSTPATPSTPTTPSTPATSATP